MPQCSALHQEEEDRQTSVRFAAQAKDKLMKTREYAAEISALGYPQFSYLKEEAFGPGQIIV
jgi:hypothetical protein